MTTYTAHVERDDDRWLISVPVIGRSTYAESQWDVERLTRNLIAIHAEEELADIDLDVFWLDR